MSVPPGCVTARRVTTTSPTPPFPATTRTAICCPGVTAARVGGGANGFTGVSSDGPGGSAIAASDRPAADASASSNWRALMSSTARTSGSVVSVCELAHRRAARARAARPTRTASAIVNALIGGVYLAGNRLEAGHVPGRRGCAEQLVHARQGNVEPIEETVFLVPDAVPGCTRR